MKRVAVLFCIVTVACSGRDFSSSRSQSSDAGDDSATPPGGGAGGASSNTRDPGRTSSDGTPPSNGSASGSADSGDTASGSSSLPSDGVDGVDGGPEAACLLITHNDGVGQNWQDCTQSNTHDIAQAEGACHAWCSASDCISCWQSSCDGEDYVFGEVSSGAETAMAWSVATDNVVEVDLATGSCVSTGTWD
jgi:hypothetical protein